MYLLVTSTTGFRTGIDCSERVADAVVDQAGAVPSMILTGFATDGAGDGAFT